MWSETKHQEAREFCDTICIWDKKTCLESWHLALNGKKIENEFNKFCLEHRSKCKFESYFIFPCKTILSFDRTTNKRTQGCRSSSSELCITLWGPVVMSCDLILLEGSNGDTLHKRRVYSLLQIYPFISCVSKKYKESLPR